MKTIIFALLFFIGTIPCLIFKQLNESRYGVFTIVHCFKEKGQYNTDTEMKFMNHGDLLSIKRDVYKKVYPRAVTSEIIQFLFLLPLLLSQMNKKYRFGGLNKRQKIYYLFIIGIGCLIWLLNYV